MNREVLALKYRPKNFDELVGQESVTKSLKIALKNGNIGNAYLFSGLRGSGKTSSARIFSKTILCEKFPISIPCETCESCQMANKGNHIDIIEMDGASNRGIEKIRELIEQTHYKPSIGKYKIFIIDEVHMLTKEAFNALLKTLEEPPTYVKFILATTDPLKLPSTILSRTQHFAFKRIDTDKIISHIMKISEIEKIKYEPKAFEIIARSGNGSLRDTLTILEQAITFTDNNIDLGSVIKMLGLVNPELLKKVLKLILEKNKTEILNIIQNELDKYEVELVLDELIELLKQELINGNIKISIIQKLFEILNESKKLLFSQVDNTFVLILTFLKMISFDEVIEYSKPIIQQPTEVKNIIEPIIESTKSIFDKFQESINFIVAGNKDTKRVTNNYLKSCLLNHVKLISFNNMNLLVEYCFGNDESSQICRDIVRHRFQRMETVFEILFKDKNKLATVTWVECQKFQIKPQNIQPQIKEQTINKIEELITEDNIDFEEIKNLFKE